MIGEVDDLLAQRERWRSEGKTMVWTNGCFDLLHIGHLRSLEGARAQGDVLVVGVNDDASVRELKGPERPAVPEDERLELVAALKPVDHVVVLRATTPVDAIARLQPDIHCKGADYAPGQGRDMPEAEVVESYGGRVVFLPLVPDRSTTSLLSRRS